MIENSAAYEEAIVGDVRRILLRAIVDIIDPDIIYGTVESSGAAAVCDPGQIHDKQFDLAPPYAALERNRWILDGQFDIFPDSGQALAGQAGFIGDVLSGDGGTFSPAVWVEEQFSNVSILQACSIYFPTAEWDGYPVDFTVEVKQGGTAYYTKTVTGNTESRISLDGFTVNNPDAIRVTVTKWSLPSRRLRVVEIVPGIYEEWTGDMIASYTMKHQGDMSCITLPYGTCSIRMDNTSRRFEPRTKNGVFQSIEERQGMDISLGCRLPDGTDEYIRAGMMYQYSGGWKTGDNGLTIQWDLVDIIGLLASREYVPPSALPDTLGSWVESIVAQLGTNFENRCTIDPGYAGVSLTVRDPSDVAGMTCGDLLRYVCMASGTWPRADAETGYLAVEPLWNQGHKITLDNLVNYPVIKANKDVAALIFTLNDGENTQYVVSGNSTASSETQSIQNPFIKTEAQALAAAKRVLSAYGGNRYEITGRGDPSSEIGDVDTVWLDESSATTARRIQQDLSFQDGVLKNCTSVLLQADGSSLFEERAVITADGTWTAPAGVTTLRLILVGGGSGGANGTDGTWFADGTAGEAGAGGIVWAGTIDINDGQAFPVSIGAGGAAGQAGTATVFGQYSSANGQTFSPNYTDIASGEAYARSGVAAPAPNTGDGGRGGSAGKIGNEHEEDGETVVDNYPTEGGTGVPGASGCAIIYWDKND